MKALMYPHIPHAGDNLPACFSLLNGYK